MSRVQLKGMTWSHPRGIDPLIACSDEWQRLTGTEIHWDKRSLQDFESYPVEELARQYDLIIIDHPHVGQVVEEHCLLPLNEPHREEALGTISFGSVGQSFASYTYQSRQWALPIDTATQVQAYVPSRLSEPCHSFDAMLELARAGRIALPLRPPHSLMCLYTLAAHFGAPCQIDSPAFLDRQVGQKAWQILRTLYQSVGERYLAMDPIAVFEEMVLPNSKIACVPFIYGYVNYAVEGFRSERIAFADIPVLEGRDPSGSALGGTGIAVSAKSAFPKQATDFAYWVASGPVQKGLYASSNGQPAHADAWEDEAVNLPTHDFYRATRKTLEGSWVRPRYNGYMAFQNSASALINECLRLDLGSTWLIDRVNEMFAASYADAK